MAEQPGASIERNFAGLQDPRVEPKEAIAMVRARATANRLVLGLVKVDDKSNEIKAVPELLRVLDISGCIVTTDAMGCQKEMATLCDIALNLFKQETTAQTGVKNKRLKAGCSEQYLLRVLAALFH